MLKWRVVAEEATTTAEEFEQRRAQIIDQAIQQHVRIHFHPTHTRHPLLLELIGKKP